MGRLFLTILLLFSFGMVHSQKGLKKSELSSDFFLMDVKSGGDNLFAVKYQGACIAYNKKVKEYLLYGDANGTDIIFLERIPNVPLHFYYETFISCNYKEGKVYLSSQMPGKATVITGIFNWKDEHLAWEKEVTFDLSEVQVIRAQAFLKAGKVNEALLTYDSVQYAESYYDLQKVGVELLLASKKTLEENEPKRKFKESVDLVERILAFKGMKWLLDLKTESDVKTAIGKSLHGLTYIDLQAYFESYTKSILELKAYDKTIEKVNFFWKYFTKSPGLLLNIADAWYAKKDKIKASEFYIKYTSQMKEIKKEKDIPYYVPQRIIE